MAQGDVNAQIGQALRRLRREQGLTVTELAAISDLSSGMISRIENGQVSPSLTTLDALAEGLQVPLMALFSDTEQFGCALRARRGRVGQQADHAGAQP